MKKLDPPTHLEPQYLFDKYDLLRKAVFKKFRDRMANHTDKEELQSAIDEIFLQLVNEFDPHREVDFPYYIKFMLEKRTYHFVTKYHKNTNKEVYGEELIIEDDNYEELFKRIVDLHSIDPTIELGEKHRNLMIGLLIRRKSLKELAEEEGAPTERLHARLYFLILKMQKAHSDNVSKYGEDLY